MPDDLWKSPVIPCAPTPDPKSKGSGGGTYDGEPGMTPGRTPSPNALPEKTYDNIPGTGKPEGLARHD